MKRALFLTFLTAFGIVACKQAAPTPEPSTTAIAPAGSGAAAVDPWVKEAPRKDPLKRPLFWSIEKDGKTSYALGTVHIGVDAEARLPQQIWDRLDAAPTFAMETDLTDPAIAKILECVRCSLRKDLGEPHWNKLEAAIGASAAASLDGMKPMVAATMLAIRGIPSTTPMDGLLLARAQNQDKSIVFLEEASHQAAILEKTMNIKALKAMLDDLEAGERMNKELMEAYVSGDEAQLLVVFESQRTHSLAHGYTAKEYDQSMEDMLYSRNAAWIAPIEKLHAAGGGFIAVGAMHLVGPKNVLELLAKQGYTISRVTP